MCRGEMEMEIEKGEGSRKYGSVFLFEYTAKRDT